MIGEPNLIIKGRSGTGKTTSLIIKLVLMKLISKNRKMVQECSNTNA